MSVLTPSLLNVAVADFETPSTMLFIAKKDAASCIQRAVRVHHARQVLSHLRFNKSIDTPEHKIAATRIQTMVRKYSAIYRFAKLRILEFQYRRTYGQLTNAATVMQSFIRMALVLASMSAYRVYVIGDGTIDSDGFKIIYGDDGVVLGREDEHGEYTPGGYYCGVFVTRYYKPMTISDLDEDARTENRILQLIFNIRATKAPLDSKFWSFLSELQQLDFDRYNELCDELNIIACKFKGYCRNIACQHEHPLGTNIVANRKAYKDKMKLIQSSSSSVSSVASDVTDDDNSAVIRQPDTLISSDFTKKAEEFVATSSVIDILRGQNTVPQLIELLRADDGDFTELANMFNPVDRIRIKSLKKLMLELLAPVETKSPAPVETKSPAPVETKSPAPALATSKSAISKSATSKPASKEIGGGGAVKTCHNSAFLKCGVCSWIPNCKLCHDAPPAAPTTQPAATPTTTPPPAAKTTATKSKLRL